VRTPKLKAKLFTLAHYHTGKHSKQKCPDLVDRDILLTPVGVRRRSAQRIATAPRQAASAAAVAATTADAAAAAAAASVPAATTATAAVCATAAAVCAAAATVSTPTVCAAAAAVAATATVTTAAAMAAAAAATMRELDTQLRCARVLRVEDMEGRQADVRDFLVVESRRIKRSSKIQRQRSG
jgi:hypothetical protein